MKCQDKARVEDRPRSGRVGHIESLFAYIGMHLREKQHP